uniref:rhomboid family intramembrane serine protease n=1 Tax=Ornithobacterium rhinotracheale TaxID=28251 RepID=UPI0039A67D4D
MELINKLKNQFINGNIAIKLIYINVAIFLLGWIIGLIKHIDYLNLYFGLSPFGSDFWSKPWSIFTYMFLHHDVIHLLFNMLMLYFVSEFYFKYFGEKSFKIFYFVGGIVGGIFYLLLFNFYTFEDSRLIGASAAIYAVFFAMVAYQPNLEMRLPFVQSPVKLLHVALGLIALGFLLSMNNLGGNISHIGGALFGYLYMKQFEKGKDIFGKLAAKLNGLFSEKSNLKMNKNAKAESQTPPRDDYEYQDWKAEQEKNIDEILDKISRSGYNSLTKEEKDFLFKRGKKQ